MACARRSRELGGWLAGCAVATAVFGAFALAVLVTVHGIHSIRFAGYVLALLFPLLLMFLFTCLLTGIPAAAAIWLSERFQIRSAFFFGAFGVATGALSHQIFLGSLKPFLPFFSLFATAGLAAGMAYWRVAGRYAGGDGAW
jgi:hypothetical protein